ncbi:MAG TPA: phosphatase PAP2 family protein [Xanthomonadaceae bacterium]|nr:phosphatase PAP2 family protein [Xanthomonadaceae bacterium]
MNAFRAVAFALAMGIAAGVPAAMASGGPFGIDHRVAYDDSGIWKRDVQKDVLGATILTTIGGTFWEGDETRLGRTFAQSLDSLVLSTIGAQAMKRVFSRERPIQTSDPDQFFTGHGNQSFPSGEVTAIASAVTPFVLEYGHDHPSIYALEALTVYDMAARVKVRAHWQSDVVVGAALGTGFGIYAHDRANPLIVSWLPHGMMVGW